MPLMQPHFSGVLHDLIVIAAVEVSGTWSKTDRRIARASERSVGRLTARWNQPPGWWLAHHTS